MSKRFTVTLKLASYRLETQTELLVCDKSQQQQIADFSPKLVFDGRGLFISYLSAFTPFTRFSSTLLLAVSLFLTQQAKGSYQHTVRWARNLQSELSIYFLSFHPLPFVLTSLFYGSYTLLSESARYRRKIIACASSRYQAHSQMKCGLGSRLVYYGTQTCTLLGHFVVRVTLWSFSNQNGVWFFSS